MTEKPRLLLIDGHSMAYRAFFALPVENFATETGQHTNAVFGFTSMLINLLRDEQPTHVAVAFDVSRESFRTRSYPDYKANRSASPPEFRGQVELVKDVLDALRIPRLELADYEADDILATLTDQATAEGFETWVCTGDRDAFQLVNEDVTVLYPRRGVSDLVRMTAEEVEERYLVSPERYPELAALVGETSDNLPGVPGVGPKTAAKWLREYDGLDNILARSEQIKGKVGESLRAHLDDVKRNRRLNALVRDLKLELGPRDLERQDWDHDKIQDLFDALEFRVLRERLQDLDPAAESRDEEFEVHGEVLAPGRLKTWLAEHGTGAMGVEFVGAWGSGTGDLTSIAFAAGDGLGAWIDVATLTPEDDAALAAWLADENAGKVVHDAKGPMLAIWARGWELLGVRTDTVLAAYLLRPDNRTFKLADLCLRHLKRELDLDGSASGEAQQAFTFEEDVAAGATEAMLRARVVLELAEVLNEELAARKESELIRDVELPLQRILGTMEKTGIAIDLDRLEGLRAEFDAAVKQAETAAYEVLGHEVNLGSPKQLQGVLFEELEMPKTRRTKSGWTTDAEALAGLFAKTGHPFLEHLLEHRDRIRLRQTVDGLLAAVQPDGRIHTTFAQTIAATGRLSSLDPNLQNIPIRTELGRRIRRAFVAGEGYEGLMTADYSQIEMRIMAHLSGDEKLGEAFRSGRDFHAEMASTVFNVDPGEVTGEMRAKIKAMNYGLAYGLSAYGLSNQLNIPVAEARKLMEDYFSRVGGVRDYLAEVVERARASGYTATMLGRRRYLPDLNSGNRQRREMAERAALNSPIQGSAADIIKLAMIDVQRAFEKEQVSSQLLLQVHDELVLEVAPGESDVVADLVRQSMAQAMDLKVPLEVSIGTGDSWFSAAH